MAREIWTSSCASLAQETSAKLADAQSDAWTRQDLSQVDELRNGEVARVSANVRKRLEVKLSN
jgi:hypothetical protein